MRPRSVERQGERNEPNGISMGNRRLEVWRLGGYLKRLYYSLLIHGPIPGPEPHMHPFIETQKEWIKNVPPFRAGDTLRVNVRVKEGDKERLQAFEGVCIGRRGAGVSETFT